MIPHPLAHVSAAPRVFGVIREAALDALAVVLPTHCAGCGRADRTVCDGCAAELLRDVPVSQVVTPGGLRVFAGRDYDGVVRSCHLALKQHGAPRVARALAPTLVAPLEAALAAHAQEGADAASAPSPVLLCPVPPSPAAWRSRGFDPVRMLLRHAAGVVPRPLARGGSSRAQKSLTGRERRENVSGTMRARTPLGGCTVLLVDDVVTTGATFDEAARAVRAAGGRVLGAVVSARTRRSHGPSATHA